MKPQQRLDAATATASPTLPSNPPPRTIVTVRQFAQQQPALTEGAIRWHLFHRESNGLATSGAIIRNGRKILIDPEAYLSWIANGGAAK